MNWLSPSILAADFNRLGEQIREVRDNGAQALHFDVMDGLFVPSISFGMPVLASVRKQTDIFLDVHLMICEPIRYVKTFAESGANLITVHYEACRDVAATIREIKRARAKAGLSVRPQTPVEVLRPYLKDLDLVLIMSVNPGFGGQTLMEGTYDKIRQLRELYGEVFGRSFGDDLPRAEVDGGVNLENVGDLLAAGADTIVTGSAVFRGDVAANVRAFLAILNPDK